MTLCMIYATKIPGDDQNVNITVEIQQSHYLINFSLDTNKKTVKLKIKDTVAGGSEQPIDSADITKNTKTYKSKMMIPKGDDILVDIHHDYKHHKKDEEVLQHNDLHRILDPRKEN